MKNVIIVSYNIKLIFKIYKLNKKSLKNKYSYIFKELQL